MKHLLIAPGMLLMQKNTKAVQDLCPPTKDVYILFSSFQVFQSHSSSLLSTNQFKVTSKYRIPRKHFQVFCTSLPPHSVSYHLDLSLIYGYVCLFQCIYLNCKLHKSRNLNTNKYLQPPYKCLEQCHMNNEILILIDVQFWLG